MNPLAEFSQRRYSSLDRVERKRIENYVLKIRGYDMGSKLIKTMDNVGCRKTTLTVVSVFNRAEEYHRRQRED